MCKCEVAVLLLTAFIPVGVAPAWLHGHGPIRVKTPEMECLEFTGNSVQLYVSKQCIHEEMVPVCCADS